VRDRDGALAIAKFPHKQDEQPTMLWEAVALTLAEQAGIVVPEWRLETIAGKAVLISKRFDRDGQQRIPYLSAMSMLGAVDNESRSYLEIADIIRRYSANAVQDLKQLWRRIVFSVAISNLDDHLRNHGFLYGEKKGWSLSPAFDLNPVPAEVKAPFLSTAIDLHDNTASFELALNVAEYFRLEQAEAKVLLAEVKKAVAAWRQVAKRFGLRNADMEKMASAFKV
jgi:serine/threonine-protein kinase HipA